MRANTLTGMAFARVPASLKQVVTFTRTTPGAVDAVTDAPSAATTSTATGKFVEAQPNGRAEAGLDGFKAGEQVREQARVLIGVMNPGSTLAPAAGDTAAWGGKTWTVVSSGALGGNAYRVAVTR